MGQPLGNGGKLFSRPLLEKTKSDLKCEPDDYFVALISVNFSLFLVKQPLFLLSPTNTTKCTYSTNQIQHKPFHVGAFHPQALLQEAASMEILFRYPLATLLLSLTKGGG